jgi:hypothetical protein
MQFLKSPILLVLALATYASASALPESRDCIPPGGLCISIGGLLGMCCSGADCILDPRVTDTGYVSTLLRCFLELMAFNTYGN